jgi:hypothetical protein
MILGLSTSSFTLVHVVLSLIGIFSGTIVLFGMFRSKRLDGWTVLFLATTVLTSVTGFFFPYDHLLPSHRVGIISLVVLAVAILALYVYRLAGSWRWLYVAGAGGGSLSQRLRRGRTGFPEAAVPEAAGADTSRAALPYHAARRFGAFRCAYRCGGAPLPQRATPNGLMGHITFTW